MRRTTSCFLGLCFSKVYRIFVGKPRQSALLFLGWQTCLENALHLDDDGPLTDRAHDVHEVALVANKNREANEFVGIVLL